MSPDTENPTKIAVGLPFTGPVARQLVEELFRLQPQWKSSTIVERVVQLHRERSGSTASNPIFAIRRVLAQRNRR
jgi:hypothetical protein